MTLWKGPQEDGITQTLLRKFYICRHRFWLSVVQGLSEDTGFNHKLEYGQFIHEGLEALAQGGGKKKIAKAVKAEEQKLLSRFPNARQKISEWARIARDQLAIYNEWWGRDDRQRDYLLTEETFNHNYKLPSGRYVRLRGKWDAVFQKDSEVWLKENKSKGRIDEDGLDIALNEDLQVMFYLIPLWEQYANVVGVLYSVIRRPLADNYAIRQKKAETREDFLKRVAEKISENKEHYFKRWKVRISEDDIARFKKECFDPILEQLCDWWEMIEENPDDPWNCYCLHEDGTLDETPMFPNYLHFRRPFGIWDGMADGLRGDFFSYITDGDKSGLVAVDNLFPELD